MNPYRQRFIALLIVASTFAFGSCLYGQGEKPAAGTTPAQTFAPTFSNTHWFPSIWEPYFSPMVA